MTSDPLQDARYDPLPLTSDDQPTTTLYNAPPSPDLNPSAFHTPEMPPTDIGSLDPVVPAEAATPRFLGAALYNDHQPRPRESFPSSYHTGISQPSEYNSSVYALNEPNVHEYRDDPRASYYGTIQDGMPMSSVGQSRVLEEKRAAYAAPATKSRRKTIILAVLAALILLVIVIVVPLYFSVIRPRSLQTDSASSSVSESSKPTSTSNPSTPQSRVVTGGDGSEVTMEDGTKFTYRNSFGGYWYYDEEDPFNNGARAQSWSPALNETFNYGTDTIRGCIHHCTYFVVIC